MKCVALVFSVILLCSCSSSGPDGARDVQQTQVPLPHGVPIPESTLPPEEVPPEEVPPDDLCADFPAVDFTTGAVSELYSVDDVEEQPDGKLIYTGWGDDPEVICRIEPDGSRDLSFGSECGCAVMEADHYATQLVLHESGFYAISGWGNPGPLVARYTADGAIDTTFGDGGWISTDFGDNFALTEALLLDGKLTIAGRLGEPPQRRAFVSRLNGDGTIDATFGTSGYVFLGAHWSPGAVALEDGRLVTIAGDELRAFDSDGVPSSSFGTDGLVQLPTGMTTVALARDGGLLLAGGGMAMLRLSPSGVIQASYPKLELPDQGDYHQYPVALGIVEAVDGSIALGGHIGVDSDYYLGMGRRLPDGSPDLAFGAGGARRYSGYGSFRDIEVLRDGSFILMASQDSSRGLMIRIW